MNPVRVRFAPSPTGFMHIGGLRTALFNYLFAKKHGGQFLLRLEDTDKSREVAGSLDSIVRVLRWAGMDYDEGPQKAAGGTSYVQSERLATYHSHAQQLVSNGHAYPCFCGAERLERLRGAQKARGMLSLYDRHCLHSMTESEREERMLSGEPHVIRLRVPKEEESITVEDLVRGEVRFTTKGVDDQVLVKSDRFPTYHLAAVVDDHLMNVSHVIRGEEWLSSTPKHMLLHKAFGWDAPKFAHLPLLLNPDGSKLSKRAGMASAEEYMTGEYFPEAVVNFVALLGWNPGTTQEIFTMEELIDSFSLENVNRSGAIVNQEKLRWVNGQHLRNRDARNSAKLLRGVLSGAAEGLTERELEERSHQHDRDLRGPLRYSEIAASPRARDVEYLADVIRAINSRVSTLFGIRDMCPYFFVGPDYQSHTAREYHRKVWDDNVSPVAVGLVLEKLGEASHDLDVEEAGLLLKETVRGLVDAGLGAKKKVNQTLMGSLRYVLTGTQVGAPLNVTMATLGRNECIQRLRAIECEARNK